MDNAQQQQQQQQQQQHTRNERALRVYRSGELHLIARGGSGRLVSETTIGGIADVDELLRNVRLRLTEAWTQIEIEDHDELPEIVKKAIALDE